jgi:hypothetical protein
MSLLAVILRLPRETDLSWYLNESGAAAGVRSSFGVLADAAAGGWGGGRQDPHGGRTRGYRNKAGDHVHPWLDAVGRERVLHDRFRRLTEVEQRILAHAYLNRRRPPETTRSFDEYVFVVPATAAFREVYDGNGTPTEWLVNACRNAQRHAKAIEAMRVQAIALVDVALDAWRATRSGKAQEPRSPEDETAKRAVVAARSVAGPKRKEEAGRTWVPCEKTPPASVRPCKPTDLRQLGAIVVGRAFRRYDIQGDPLIRPLGWTEPKRNRGDAGLCGGLRGWGVWCEAGDVVDAGMCTVDADGGGG